MSGYIKEINWKQLLIGAFVFYLILHSFVIILPPFRKGIVPSVDRQPKKVKAKQKVESNFSSHALEPWFQNTINEQRTERGNLLTHDINYKFNGNGLGFPCTNLQICLLLSSPLLSSNTSEPIRSFNSPNFIFIKPNKRAFLSLHAGDPGI